MAICDAQPLGVRLEVEPPSPAPSSTAPDTQETLNAELHNLKLEENPEPKSDEVDSPKLEEEPKEESEEKLVPLSKEKPEQKDERADQGVAVVEGEKMLRWPGNFFKLIPFFHRLQKPEENDRKDAVVEEEKAEEKDRKVAVVEEDEKREKDLEQSDEVKADGWGWDQDFTAPEGNQNVEKDLEWTSEKKVEAWGWDQETGGSGENAKGEKGSESLIEEKRQRRKSPFPQRTNESDCSFFVKTGTCRYGLNCKFNHPPSRMRNNEVKSRKLPESAQAVELNGNGASSEMVGQTMREKANKERQMGSPSESNGQMDCKYYLMPGGCKYGSTCKYKHKEKTEVPAKLNFLGLPMRPGEKECTYYMSTGSCKYSTNCRFHHPDPIAVGGQDTASGYQNGGSSQSRAPPAQLPMTSWPVQQTPTEPVPFLDTLSPYVTGYFLPPQGFHPNPEWNGYQAPPPVNPLFPAEMNMPHPSAPTIFMNMPHPSATTMKDTVRKENGSAPRTAPDGEYPERPGQAECPFFMKTGTCKFKSACKFHHPKSRLPKTSGIDASPVGMPLRPDQPVCTHYSRHGICKYGRACRYNHPMDSNPSVSLAAVAQSSVKVFPETDIDSQEVKARVGANQVQESEW